MGNMPSHKIFNYATVSFFERTKATDIERLELVGRMGRHTKRNNVVVVAVGLEICQMVAFVTIEDKETFRSLCTLFCMLVEMLNPIQAYVIRNPSIFRNSQLLIVG